MNVQPFLALLKRNTVLIVAIPAVVTATAAVVAFLMPDLYRTEAVLEVGRIMDITLESPNSVAARMANSSYLAVIAKNLGWDESPMELADTVKPELLYVDAREQALSRVMIIRVTGRTPERAAYLAKAILDDVVKFHAGIYDHDFRVHEAQIEDYERSIKDMEEGVAAGDAELEAMVKSGRVNQVEAAYLASYLELKEDLILNMRDKNYDIRRQLYSESVTRPTRILVEPLLPRTPVGPPRVRIVAVSFLLSLLFAAVVAFFVEQSRGKPETSAPSRERPEKEAP